MKQVSAKRNGGMKRENEKKERGCEGRPRKADRTTRSEKHACPRKGMDLCRRKEC
jgi:hypothetical protein